MARAPGSTTGSPVVGSKISSAFDDKVMNFFSPSTKDLNLSVLFPIVHHSPSPIPTQPHPVCFPLISLDPLFIKGLYSFNTIFIQDDLLTIFSGCKFHPRRRPAIASTNKKPRSSLQASDMMMMATIADNRSNAASQSYLGSLPLCGHAAQAHAGLCAVRVNGSRREG